MAEQIITIATPAELELVKRHPEFSGIPVIITGVGPLCVIRAMRDVPKETQIINIGYAGSVDLEIGREYRVGSCALFHKVDFESPEFIIDSGIECYSSSDFVTEATEKGCAFDMELAFIRALGFQRICAYKTISDHCNYNEYEQTTK